MIYSLEHYDRICPQCINLDQQVIGSSERFIGMTAQQIFNTLERERQESNAPQEVWETQLHKRTGSKCTHIWFVGCEYPELEEIL